MMTSDILRTCHLLEGIFLYSEIILFVFTFFPLKFQFNSFFFLGLIEQFVLCFIYWFSFCFNYSFNELAFDSFILRLQKKSLFKVSRRRNDFNHEPFPFYFTSFFFRSIRLSQITCLFFTISISFLFHRIFFISPKIPMLILKAH